MSLLAQAYREHGIKMEENISYRSDLYTAMLNNPRAAATEWELCMMPYDPDASGPTGVIRFFEYHLWTHETRPHMLRAYGDKFIGNPTLPFMLFDFQKEAVLELCNAIELGEDVLIDKTRDMGVSWLAISVFLYYFLREKGSDFLIGSRKFEYVDKKEATDTLFQKFRYNLYRLQPVFFPRKFNENKNDNVGFISNPDNGNYVRGEANNANFGTSGRYRAILADEYSKWEETDEAAWTSMGDSTPSRIPVSTPYGIGRKFAKLRHSGEIRVLTFHWSDHPIKGVGKYRGQHPLFPDKKDVWLSEWYLKECERRKGNAKADIGQELDIDYLSSGMPYFNNDIIQRRYIDLDRNPPKIIRYGFERVEDGIEIFKNDNGRIYIKEEPVSGWKNRYLISADVAEGLEKGDNSVMIVYDRVKNEDVAWFAGKIDTTIFAYLLSHFGYKYNDAYIAPENNNHGHAVIKVLKEIYPFIMHEQDYGRVVDMDKVKLGWNTNVATRPVMCGDLRSAINSNVDGIMDKQTFSECLTFVYNKNGKAEADVGCLDDRVMAQAIKFQLHNWLPSPQENKKQHKKEHDVKRFGGWPVSGNKKDRRSIWVR